MCCNKRGCTVVAEVLTSADTIGFPYLQRLEGQNVKSLLVRKSNSETLKSRGRKQIAADSVVFTAHFQIKNSNGNTICEDPISVYFRDANAPEAQAVNWNGFSPSQSTITLDTSAAGYNAGHVLEFVFEVDCPAGVCE